MEFPDASTSRPFRFNISKRGWRSTSIKLGPFTYNFSTHRKSVDTPGPGSFQFGGKSRSRPRRTSVSHRIW